MRIGKLNYCGFYSILPELEKAINSDPDSPTAQIIQNRIERQTKAYSKRKNQFDLTENMAQELRAKKSEESEY
ncbi:MAG: hypothetical protein C0599_00745 [Salinivirgaceae bacterium]|nr:MAG: hypothetical protein C0599_00745 [Salinivirgaceae bacterium]